MPSGAVTLIPAVVVSYLAEVTGLDDFARVVPGCFDEWRTIRERGITTCSSFVGCERGEVEVCLLGNTLEGARHHGYTASSTFGSHTPSEHESAAADLQHVFGGINPRIAISIMVFQV
jgi:hypothetical protein